MTQKPDPYLFELQQLVEDLSKVERNHSHIADDRHENDIEHSFSVALLCWYILKQQKLNLDFTRVLKYALAHDFVERYAGDTNTFAEPELRALKTEAEREALERLSSEFAQFPDLIETMRSYEERSDDEALFVWTVDKMQALILGDLDMWRPYEVLSITYSQFCVKYEELTDESSPFCREIFESLISYCKTTYYDQPTH